MKHSGELWEEKRKELIFFSWKNNTFINSTKLSSVSSCGCWTETKHFFHLLAENKADFIVGAALKVQMFMLVHLWSMMLLMRQKDDPTRGPWEINMAAFTAGHRPGYFPVSKTDNQHLTASSPSWKLGGLWSTWCCRGSWCVSASGGSRWVIILMSFLSWNPVWECPLTTGSPS